MNAQQLQKKTNPDINFELKKILTIYKKLKQIARYESIKENKSERPHAKLTSEQLDKISLLEKKLDCTLIAYENKSASQRKEEILNGIDILMDEYINLLTNKKSNVINLQKKSTVNISDDFSNFFE